MRICIDARIPNIGGIRTYTYELLESLLALDHENEYFIFYDKNQNKRGYNNAQENFVPTKSNIFWILWNETYLPLYLKRMKIDIFHSFKHVGALFSQTRSVITIHDVGPFLFPESFPVHERYYWRVMLKLAAKKYDRVITVSQSSKNTISEVLGVPLEKIKVTYLGVDHSRFTPLDDKESKSRVREKYGIPPNFLFWIGQMMGTKNLDSLIKVYADLRKQHHICLKLVLAGRKEGNYDDLKKLAESLDIQHDVIFLGIVDSQDLPLVYNLADVFVFPSLHEGFGLPALEAMACGIPVVCSNKYSLPEVVGDAAVTFNPYDLDDLKDVLLKVISDPTLRKDLAQKGLSRSMRFHFDKCAKETLELYQEMLQ